MLHRKSSALDPSYLALLGPKRTTGQMKGEGGDVVAAEEAANPGAAPTANFLPKKRNGF